MTVYSETKTNILTLKKDTGFEPVEENSLYVYIWFNLYPGEIFSSSMDRYHMCAHTHTHIKRERQTDRHRKVEWKRQSRRGRDKDMERRTERESLLTQKKADCV